MPTDVPGSVPWIIGVLIAVILALVGVIVYLFKLNNTRTLDFERQRREVDLAHAAEREKWTEEKSAWDAEREAEHAQLLHTYEQKHREIAEQYIETSMRDRADHIAREKQTRDDFGELLEKLAAKGESSSAAMVELLHKLQDRLLGGRRRGG